MANNPYVLSTLEIGEILSKGWDLLKDHWQDIGKLVGAYLLATIVPQYILVRIFSSALLSSLISIVFILWSTFLSMGLIKGILSIVRGETVEIPEIYQNQEAFGEYAVMVIRYMVVIIGGGILLILPGIYFAIRYIFVPFLVVDKKATGAAAFAKSKEMTEGRLGFFIAYFIITVILVMVGSFVLLVGAIAAGLICGLGMVLVYENLMKKS